MKKLIIGIINKIFPKPNILQLLQSRGLKVGKNFSMQSDVIIDPSHSWHIQIGDDVTLAPRVYILAHNASTKRELNYTRIGKVYIGNNVFIGASTIILPGVRIGNNVVVGAGSVVQNDIPDNSIAVGNPVRVIGSFDDFIFKKKKEMESVPCFGEEYTLRKQVTEEMKDHMNKLMDKNIGYII